MTQADHHPGSFDEPIAAGEARGTLSRDDGFDGMAMERIEFQDSRPSTDGSPGVAYRHYLIVPIAGPAPEHAASYLLFEKQPDDARTRLGLFNVRSDHASVEQAHHAALKAGIDKVDALLGPL